MIGLRSRAFQSALGLVSPFLRFSSATGANAAPPKPKSPLDYKSKLVEYEDPDIEAMNDDGTFTYYNLPPKDYRRLQNLEQELSGEMPDRRQARIARSAYFSVERNGTVYHVFNAETYVYGRMMSKVATFLQGKHKPTYRQDSPIYGDIVIIVNATKVKMTGQKLRTKEMTYHTGYIGQLKTRLWRNMLKEKPEQLLTHSLNKMLPKNKLKTHILKKLFIFREQTHTFEFLPNVKELLNANSSPSCFSF